MGHLKILALAYPSLIVIFLNFSFEVLTVLIPEIALTTVDFPWATWPMVPMLMVAYRLMTDWDRGVSTEASKSSNDYCDNCGGFEVQ